jgi:hypothetical protein
MEEITGKDFKMQYPNYQAIGIVNSNECFLPLITNLENYPVEFTDCDNLYLYIGDKCRNIYFIDILDESVIYKRDHKSQYYYFLCISQGYTTINTGNN